LGLGGAGVVSSISGSAIQYACGGNGGIYSVISPLPFLGAGRGGWLGTTSDNRTGQSAASNTGSGGGGAANNTGLSPVASGSGGSGIVILRYPSYLAPATSTTGGPEMYVAGAWRVYKFVASGTITF
jgi:hypothetical protein